MSSVTIVMAARNAEKWIDRALRTCFSQDGLECDVVVVDDASEDRTARIAQGWGANVYSNVKHEGLPYSLNVGIRAAKTRFVVRVDADDYVTSDFAYILAQHLELNPDMQAVACDYYTVDANERHLDHVSSEMQPIGCGIMFRKDKLVEIGLYDESFHLAEDAELRTRFQWPVHHCRLPLYRYRKHPGSLTAIQKDAHDEAVRMLREARAFADSSSLGQAA